MWGKIIFLVLGFFLILNFTTTGGHFDSHDGIFYFLVAENVVLNQSIKIDPNSPSVEILEFEYGIENFVKIWVPENYDNYQKGEKIPFFLPGGILGPLLAVPAYTLSLITNTDPVIVVSFFTNSVIIAFTSFIIFLISKNLFKSQKKGFILALVFNLSSFIWPYNTSFFLQPALSLILIASVYFLLISKGKKINCIIISGALLGLSLMIHPSTVILLPGFLIYALWNIKFGKASICYLITFFSIAGIQILVNYVKYNSITNFGYDTIDVVTSHSDWEGIIGLIFSPGWGIIFYFPLILLAPIALKQMFQTNKKLVFLTVYTFFSIWLFFGTEPTPHWSGFGAWGPRYLIPFLPLAVISLGYLFDFPNRLLKVLFITFGIAGFFVNLLGKLVWYLTGYSYGWGVDRLLEKENSFDYFAWSPYYSPIIEHLKVLITNYGYEIINPITKKTGCAIDIFIYCTGGVVPFAIMLIITLGIGYFCFKNMYSKQLQVGKNDI